MVQVPEDELAGRYAVAVSAGDRRLRDAVMKPERLVIVSGRMPRAGCPVFVDTARGRPAEWRQLALCDRGLERLLVVPVDDEERVQRLRARSAELPAPRSLSSVSPRIRDRAGGDALLKLRRERAQHAGGRPHARRPVGSDAPAFTASRGLWSRAASSCASAQPSRIMLSRLSELTGGRRRPGRRSVTKRYAATGRCP